MFFVISMEEKIYLFSKPGVSYRRHDRSFGFKFQADTLL